MIFPRRFMNRFGCLNLSIFMCFLAVYLFFQIRPIVQSFFGEEDLFYGYVSLVAVSSVWNESGIPLFDKSSFCINGDKNAFFILALSRSQQKELNSWFQWWASETRDAAALEVRAIRISRNTWVVREINSREGSLSSASVRNFHMRSVFWAILVDVALLFGAFISLREYFSYYRHQPWFTPGRYSR
jgi:hypothetical protein